MWNIWKLILCTLVIMLAKTVDSRRHSPQLIEDDGSARRSNRPAECQFGKTFRELGSTWYADLGPPFGIMYCIKCECVPVHKKRRIVAKVQCRNIKNECPVLNCDDSVLLPGKCCKTCPEDVRSTDVAQDVPIQVTNEEEERNMKHFAALLTGRTSYFLKREEMRSMYSTNNPQNVVATGRFTFHKKNLYYSFYVSSKIMRPRAIQFVDFTGNILEEHNFSSQTDGSISMYQNNTGKVCGVWRRVPRDYKRLLRDEQMYVVLLWGGKSQAELALAGQIAKYTALSTELFSSLLEPAVGTKPDQMAGAGGTAIVSTSSGATSSVHLTLVFNGLFNMDEIADVPISIRIESLEKRQTILEDVQRVKKPVYDVNVLEISSPVTTHDLRLLSRGKLVITVESRKYPGLRLQGHLSTRVACEVFQTLLTPQNFDSKTRTSGLAWMYLNRDGYLVYNIQTDELNLQETPIISLVDERGKRKTELEDLTPSLNYNQAIGIIEKLGPRVLEPLYSDDLAINVATAHETSLMRGRLVSRQVADSRDSLEPILLKRLDYKTPAHLIGMAWLAVDNECSLHYEVTLNGFFSQQQSFKIYLEEKPIEAPGAPVTRKLLDEFTGYYMEGFVLGLSSMELAKLETSVCYLEIHSSERDEILLRGKLKSTKVPGHCFPMHTDNNVPSVIVPGDQNDNHLIPMDSKCYHSGRFYDEGEQWQSSIVSCTMCACQHGRASCEPMKCPSLKCKAGEELKTPRGQCCPSCMSHKLFLETNNSAQLRGCQLGDQFHLAGSTWHPYLPPNGFDTCATCTCDPITLEIHCPKMVCPPLTCPERLAYRPDKKACCKVCAEVRPGSEKNGSPSSRNVQHDQMNREPQKSTEEILASGGCKAANAVYENGHEWHPILASHGEQKCIKCRCKDSQVSCDRKRCTRSVCNNRLKRKGSQVPENDDCCTSNQCRRTRRHQSHKKSHRDRDDRHTATEHSAQAVQS